MNIDLSVKKFNQAFARFFERFHVVVFSVVIAGGLAALVLTLSSVLRLSGESNGYQSPSNSASFDQTTINRIEQLKARGDTDGGITLPSGRNNPFVE